MKKRSKETISLIFTTALYIFFFILIAIYYLWVKEDSKTLRTVNLSEGTLNGEVYSLPDFDVKIGPRGGDSGAWMKDPIRDEDGKKLRDESVGIIYEMVMTNTSSATINDWTLELYMPEFMWLNNAWCGKLEFHQTGENGVGVQVIDLREYLSYEIEIDHYIDHTGPMIPLEKGDKFVYYPSKADNELPLYPYSETEEVNSTALIGFIVYIPDKGLDYAAVFDNATFNYYLRKSAWDEPLFIVLVGIDILCLVLMVGFIMTRIRVHTLLKQQKHDAIIIEHSISTLINFVEAKDPNTKGHSERAAKIAYALAKEMKYSERECHDIRCIALMHDCGKIAVPVSILRKPDRLTDEEYEIIKRHTTVGGEMLRDFTSINDMNLGALYHHERYDGKGYPNGLKGEEIPLIARIICVADSLDAMNSNRCYRPRLTKEVITEELIKNKGKQFDPVVIDHLMKLIQHGDIVIGE